MVVSGPFKVSRNLARTPSRSPQAVRFQDAQAMYNQRRLETKRDAAAIAEMKESTFGYRMAGRRPAEDYAISQRRLTAEEESILLWRCDITACRLVTRGKLPAKWHMPSRIEEDIGNERTKLVESQAELCELELRASHIPASD